MNIGIVGNGADKFTPDQEERVRDYIRVITRAADAVVSGRSPLGGIDAWAEEEAKISGKTFIPCEPRQHSWSGEYGYKARNLDIAEKSDMVYVILSRQYPQEYTGRRFSVCYHCTKDPRGEQRPHVKSGGCWTGLRALDKGKRVRWLLV